jgi:hypothetical protein
MDSPLATDGRATMRGLTSRGHTGPGQAKNGDGPALFGFKPQLDDRVLSADIITVIQDPSNHLAGAPGAPGARPLFLKPGALAPSPSRRGMIEPSTHGRLRSSSLPSTTRRKRGAAGTQQVPGSPKAGEETDENSGAFVMGKERIARDLQHASDASLVQGSYAKDMRRFEAFERKLDNVFGPSEILQRIDDEADRLERRETARIRALHQTKTLQQQKALAAAIGKPINDRALAGVHAVVDGRAGASTATIFGPLSASASRTSMGSLMIDPSASSGPGPVPSMLSGLSIPGEEREPKYNLRKTMDPSLWTNASERLQKMFNNPPVPAGTTKFNALRSGYETHYQLDDFSYSKPLPGQTRDATVDKEFPLGKKTFAHANRHNTEPLS